MRCLILCAVLSAAAPAWAVENPDSLFAEAGQQYDLGRFNEAARQYDSLLSAGYTLPQVYFNLGNAQFRAGLLGEAIWAYRSALNLAPRDVDIEANLTVARLACKDRIEVTPPGLFQQVWRASSTVLSVGEGAMLVTWLWWGLWVIIAFALLLPWVRPWALPVLRILGLAWLVAAATLAIRHVAQQNTQAGVLIAAETHARSAPGSDADVAFTGHSGMECLVRGRKDDFLLIELANGRVGWIPVADLKQIDS